MRASNHVGKALPRARAPTALAANGLLAALPRAAREQLLAVCDQIELLSGVVLHEPGACLEHAYFPTSGFISVMVPVDLDSVLEVGLVGDEGMLGLPLLLGVDSSPLRALVQGAGQAWRVDARSLRITLDRYPQLRRRLLLYLQVSIWQLAQTAACTRFHLVEQRLARWLLMTQDRAHCDEFAVTQAFLAYMLGVRRVGVTQAASALQRRHLIQYRRGAVTVLDRAGMQLAACSCYQSDRDTYAGLLGTAGRRARETG